MMDLIEEVNQQFNEEVEEDGVSSKENHALRMKYGLSNVSLIPSEKYLILKEERESGNQNIDREKRIISG